MTTETKLWNKPGDTCPQCGSTNTTVRDFKQEILQINQIGGEPVLVRGTSIGTS